MSVNDYTVESELYDAYIKALNYANLREIVIFLLLLLRSHVTSFAKEGCIFDMFPDILSMCLSFSEEH